MRLDFIIFIWTGRCKLREANRLYNSKVEDFGPTEVLVLMKL